MTTRNAAINATGRIALVMLTSIVVAWICLWLSENTHHQRDALYGWSAGILLHLFGITMFHLAVGRPGLSFLAISIGFIFFRLFILIILIVIVLMRAFLQPVPFICGVLPAYFIGSWMEIAWLAAANNRRFSLVKTG